MHIFTMKNELSERITWGWGFDKWIMLDNVASNKDNVKILLAEQGLRVFFTNFMCHFRNVESLS